MENLPREWWDGRRWLAYCDGWPEQKEITSSRESEKEAKMVKEVI